MAQSTQCIISFALTIGLFTLIGRESSDSAYGTVLLLAVLLVLLAVVGLLFLEFQTLVKLFFPDAVANAKARVLEHGSTFYESWSSARFAFERQVDRDRRNDIIELERNAF